jgi:adenylylsulfate kinase-like enzyme
LREQASEVIGKDRFHEIHVDASVEWAAQRDETGLYAKADQDEVKNLAGVTGPYEQPSNPAVHLPMEELSTHEAVEKLLSYLREQEVI